MNKVILMGRLTRYPEIRNSNGENSTAVAKYTLAVDRRGKRDENGQNADFINCVTFGRGAEFAQKYLHKGIKIVVTGRIQTGSYTNRDGKKIYTTEVVVDEHEFAESKNSSSGNIQFYDEWKPGVIITRERQPEDGEGFFEITTGIEDELPFT